MQSLSEHQLLTGLVAISSILLFGRGTAELAKRCNQPEVLGELVGGFVLGPSILGLAFPSVYHLLFGDPGVGLALSMFAWTGAILLLIVAGAEVDLTVLNQHKKAGCFAAIFTIVPSIVVGTIFATHFMQMTILSAVFFGIVLAVTAVSVIAKILIESKSLRRGYAQVILAAGIASEIVVWPLISAVSALHSGDSWLVGLKTTAYACVFFALMLTVGQKFVDWIMRRMADFTTIIYGQLSLLVILGFFFAEVTEILGLHPLLGPFVFGVLIGRAPRATAKLKDSIHSMSLSVFAPVFFVTAGMRVDVTKLTHPDAFSITIGICFVAMLTKVVFGFIGGKLSGLRSWESVLVGLGANMRGGTDVIVAILGGSLGIISESAYSMYAIAAILTVFISPPLIKWLEKKVPATDKELERLSKEAAKSRAYLAGVERVLLPTFPDLHPTECIPILGLISTTKERENEVFDIAEIAPDAHTRATQSASDAMKELSQTKLREHSKVSMSEKTIVESVLESAKSCDLIMIGARSLSNAANTSFGHIQDAIIDSAQKDVLVISNGKSIMRQKIRKILVPVNGMEFSMAAADVGAYIARSAEAELVLLHVVAQPASTKAGISKHALMRQGLKTLKEVKFRTRRLDIQVTDLVLLSQILQQK